MSNCLIENFEKNVFKEKIIKERLSSDVYEELKKL